MLILSVVSEKGVVVTWAYLVWVWIYIVETTNTYTTVQSSIIVSSSYLNCIEPSNTT